MNRFAIVMLLVLAVLAGAGIGHYWAGRDALEGASEKGAGEREILYWVAPMDPNFRRDEPGKSPMGMDLVPVYAGDEPDQDAVTISPAVVQNLGVRTEVAERGNLWRMIRATGYVDYDESLISHVHLRTDGWIETLAVDTRGEAVAEGEVLAQVYSPTLLNAQKEYLAAAGRGPETVVDAAGEKLRALGMTDRQIGALRERGRPFQNFDIVAPRAGIVAELNVRDGMFVMPATTVMSIADLASVWVHAAVFESQADWVALGQPAEMTVDYLPGERFEGEVVFIDPVLDPKTRTLNVRLRFDNPEQRLKPNMFAAVRIFGGPKRDVLSIPAQALIRGANRDRVVLALGNGRFQSREVVSGMRSGDWVEIVRGLEAGDRVVTSAQFLIDSEASLAGSLKRLEDQESAEDRGPWSVTGRLVARSGKTLTIEHDPVEALGWPGMTMDFQASDGAVDAGVEPGDEIHFLLAKEADGSFVVREIHGMADGAADDGSGPP